MTAKEKMQRTPQGATSALSGVYAANGQFLGTVSNDACDSESIASWTGPYGNIISRTCLWNIGGEYGSSTDAMSAYNASAKKPPSIYVDGAFRSYVTKNTSLSPRTDPDDLARMVGHKEFARD